MEIIAVVVSLQYIGGDSSSCPLELYGQDSAGCPLELYGQGSSGCPFELHGRHGYSQALDAESNMLICSHAHASSEAVQLAHPTP